MRLFLQRSLYRLTLTAGIFCFIEIYFHLTEGTRPNYVPPWGHYVASVGVTGCLLLGVAWISRPAETPIQLLPEEASAAKPLPTPGDSRKKTRRRRKR